MSTLEEKRLIVKIIHYFRSKLSTGELAADQVESLEVALQCIESTFNINSIDPVLNTDVDLLQLFSKEAKTKAPTESDKAESERLKNEGNDLMKEGKFDEAVDRYTKAIQLFHSPPFFCNRAAAYSKLEKHVDAIEDCRIALQLDPAYGKAHGRMGLAYSCLGRYAEAKAAYEKALELEPNNESFKNNLKIAEEKLSESHTSQNQGVPGSDFGGFPGFGVGGFNPMGFLNNPAMAQMAQQLMSDPNITGMISNFMGNLTGPGAPTNASSQPTGQNNNAPSNASTGQQPPQAAGFNLNNLFDMGQRFASMMQQQNPELVEQLRRQFQGSGENHPPNNDENGGNQNQ